MGNMGYVRFTNTLQDLRDCFEHLYDDDLSPEEERARQRLIKLCRTIADEAEDEEDGDICHTCSLVIQCKQQPVTRYACKQNCVTTGQPAPERCKHGAVAV